VSSAPPRPGPGGLGIGDRVWFQARLHTVVGLSGTLVRLADEHGQVSALHLAQLQASPGFAVVAQRAAVRVSPAGRLERLPEAVVARAVWWEGHILEVLTGRVADAAPGTLPRPAYDPTVRSLAEREAAKAAELAAAGQARVSVGTVRRKRLRYQAKGLGGLVDGRADRHRDAGGRVYGRVVAALEQAIAEATDASSRTVGWFRWRTEQWPQALAMARSVLPHRHLLAVDERLAQAAARPVIVPRSCATTARRSSPATSRHPAGFWASTSSPVMKEPRPTSRTSRRCWPRWPRCSPSSWPATPAPTWNVVAGTCRRRWCGRCWSCRNCWTNGSSRPGKTAAMMGYATRSARGGRSRRTRSTPPWLRPPATCRSRCRPRTTSSCCLRPGGQSTPTA
jgi:hypothetical protein